MLRETLSKGAEEIMRQARRGANRESSTRWAPAAPPPGPESVPVQGIGRLDRDRVFASVRQAPRAGEAWIGPVKLRTLCQPGGDGGKARAKERDLIGNLEKPDVAFDGINCHSKLP